VSVALPRATTAGTIDFFAAQDAAARRAHRLFALILVCAALVVVTVDLWVGLIVAHHIGYQMGLEGRGAAGAEPPWRLLMVVPLEVYAAATAAVLAIMVAAILKRERELRRGSAAFAESLGARPIDRHRPGERERQIVNVADEMALAAELLPPALYVLDAEGAINALTFASSREDTAVIVTRGAVEKLSRPELQALIGHVLGRVRDGDVDLNVRLIGWLAGLTAVVQIGTWLMRMPARAARLGGDRDEPMNDLTKAAFAFSLVFVLIGGVVAAIGYAGVALARWIRALGARQRVLLGDAAALQFTRNPPAVMALLRRLKQAGAQRMAGRYREELGPLLFVPGVGWRCIATHPSVAKRIAALEQD
jgi:Zn-dependent protease with chaperone function